MSVKLIFSLGSNKISIFEDNEECKTFKFNSNLSLMFRNRKTKRTNKRLINQINGHLVVLELYAYSIKYYEKRLENNVLRDSLEILNCENENIKIIYDKKFNRDCLERIYKNGLLNEGTPIYSFFKIINAYSDNIGKNINISGLSLSKFLCYSIKNKKLSPEIYKLWKSMSKKRRFELIYGKDDNLISYEFNDIKFNYFFMCLYNNINSY
jgi:hypothetical protein